MDVYYGPLLKIDNPEKAVRKYLTNEIADRLSICSVNQDSICYLISNIKGPREFSFCEWDSERVTLVDPENDISWFNTEFAKEIAYFKSYFETVSVESALMINYS